MNPETLPLRDIHLPEAIGWWPLAPGWWLLLAIVVLLAVAGWSAWQWRTRRVQRVAQRELSQLHRQWRQAQDNQQLLAGLSVLLRRLAIASHGRTRSAGLSGQHWQHYLNRGLGGAPFSSHPGNLLIDAQYRPHAPALESQDVQQLIALCQRRIIARSRPEEGAGA